MILAPTQLDIGTLFKGVTKKFWVTIKNDSFENTYTIKASTSCGCSSPEPSEFELGAGGEQKIGVSIVKPSAITAGSVKLYCKVLTIDGITNTNTDLNSVTQIMFTVV